MNSSRLKFSHMCKGEVTTKMFEKQAWHNFSDICLSFAIVPALDWYACQVTFELCTVTLQIVQVKLKHNSLYTLQSCRVQLESSLTGIPLFTLAVSSRLAVA